MIQQNPITEYEVVIYTIPQSGSVGSVLLLPIDQPPMIALTSPTNGSKYATPATIQISANATDDDAVQFIDLFAGTNLLRRVAASPYAISWTNAPVGQHEIYAIAVDTINQYTRSQSAMVTVETSGPVLTPPAAPTSLTGRFNRSNGRVRLDWTDAANNEQSNVVERSTDGTNFTAITTLAANTIRYVDATVQRGVLYYYRARAVNTAGSRVSNTISLQT